MKFTHSSASLVYQAGLHLPEPKKPPIFVVLANHGLLVWVYVLEDSVDSLGVRGMYSGVFKVLFLCPFYVILKPLIPTSAFVPPSIVDTHC